MAIVKLAGDVPFDTDKVINGSFGSLTLNGKQVKEVKSGSAKIEKEYSDVEIAGTFWTAEKLTGIKGSGEFKTAYARDLIVEDELKSLANHKDLKHELTMKLADPDAYNGQYDYVRYTNVKFKEIPTSDFEAKKLGERTYSFTFVGMELIERIKWTM